MITLIALSRLIRNGNQTTKKKRKNNESIDSLQKKKILRNIFLSFGAIFALVTAAHAQNLYVSANVPGGNHAIFEYTPDLGCRALTLPG
jgi:hypothetical protein